MAGLSNYARRMARLSAQIFGEVTRNTDKKSMRVVKMFSEKPIWLKREIVDYYPNHDILVKMMADLRKIGLYRDEHQDFKEEMRRLRALRGKVKPKKGEGKRASKRK
ncbi:28S ribosomal protein S33, mitochondrial-like [Branchiostoma floridae]|uniref:Small ribosomal subunit protein mS33 n=1 Tax=Branchiostoma floridae TaxID=7739 RepID=C3Z2Z3_BRAFL|nr:28S ribosomal protein S33, mitochondrial-like [Branchiostoma floridae]|eukprot:XP_002597382.1 hypothetical protein BRAFLDRAFT_113697 [Branchiostoma floridae]